MKKRIQLLCLVFIMISICVACGTNKEDVSSTQNDLEIQEIDKKMTNEEIIEILCDGEYITEVREESIVIPGVKDAYQFLYMSDLHIIIQSDEVAEGDRQTIANRYNTFSNINGKKADEIYLKLIENVNKTDIDAVLMGGDMIDYLSKSNWEYLSTGLNTLNKPYLFATADHDFCTWWTSYSEEESLVLKNEMNIDLVNTLEYDDFIVLSIGENTSQLTEDALVEIEKVFQKNKPIIIVTHVPFESPIDSGLGEKSKMAWGDRKLLWGNDCSYVPDNTTQKLIDMIHAEDTPVVAILTGHLHFEYICMLNEDVKQYVFNPAYSGEVVLITVEGE